MSIAAAPLTFRSVADQNRLNGTAGIPASRILVAKPDVKLIPEPR
jgi:hypothetical protein